jgi:F0F1-type ATP synthase assembly protein I
MPFHRPIPDSKSQTGAGRRQSPSLNSYVQAEKIMQIAFVLPCSLLLGWGAGWCVDDYFHTRWAVPAGLILGIVAGMVGAIRMAMAAMNPPQKRGPE